VSDVKLISGLQPTFLAARKGQPGLLAELLWNTKSWPWWRCRGAWAVEDGWARSLKSKRGSRGPGKAAKWRARGLGATGWSCRLHEVVCAEVEASMLAVILWSVMEENEDRGYWLLGWGRWRPWWCWGGDMVEFDKEGGDGFCSLNIQNKPKGSLVPRKTFYFNNTENWIVGLTKQLALSHSNVELTKQHLGSWSWRKIYPKRCPEKNTQHQKKEK